MPPGLEEGARIGGVVVALELIAIVTGLWLVWRVL